MRTPILLLILLASAAAFACGSDDGDSGAGAGQGASPAAGQQEKAEPGAEGAIWTRQFGSERDDDARGLAVDAEGNVILAGTTTGTLPGQTSAGFADAWVTKHDSSGSLQWTRQFGSTEEAADSGEDVATDSAGNIYVVGRTASSFQGTTNVGGFDAYLRKYGPDGSELSTAQLGTEGRDQAFAVAVDGQDSVYVLGETRGAFEGQTQAGKEDIFLVKVDSSGQQAWTTQFGTDVTDSAKGLAVTDDGHAYVVGSSLGSIDPAVVKTANDNDGFIAKLDPSGSQLWVRQFGSGEGESETVYAVAVGPSGNVFLAGRVSGELPEKSTWGGFDAFVTKYDADGNLEWTRQFGSDQGLLDSDSSYSLATDSDGNVYVSGITEGHLPGMRSYRAGDVWLRKYDPDGKELLTRQFGSDETESGQGIVVAPDGSVYVAGLTTGELPGLDEASLCRDKLRPETPCKLEDAFVRKYPGD